MESRVLVLTSDGGVERVELTEPWRELEGRGATLTHVATGREVGLVDADLDASGTRTADVLLGDADVPDLVAEHELLLVPGGTVNADRLRTEDGAVALVRAFAEAGRPVAAICHGPWLLVEANLVRGKDLTSFPSLRTDVVNAGGTWHDRAPVICTRRGWTLVTARSPEDLEEFSDAVCDILGL
ncbi:DJ-1/PfpI family protein [Paraoerskovia marina]|uniref:DJ-1/PfpI family protein n=1 Tax=Paraoerskovia marina TaxID=545619 RepID=UPI000492DDDC|nr:DJ-1/PfpI family protein [Paraoerskovia marina]